MDNISIKYIEVLGRFARFMADLEGMKVLNKEREMRNESIAYNESSFARLPGIHGLDFDSIREIIGF